MKKQLVTALVACCLLAAFSMPASATEYSFDGPEAGLFGTPTSEETIFVGVGEAANTNRSKDAAYIPPTFGSPTSYTLGTGERLTPNLISDSESSTVSGTGGGIQGSHDDPAQRSSWEKEEQGNEWNFRQQAEMEWSGLCNDVMPPSYTESGSTNTGFVSTGYTALTDDLYYSGGYLATLKIPSIGLTVKVYEGTDSAALRNGAGHFEGTSIWDGNVAIAGHNRGVNNHFGKIHTLSIGDAIKLTTKLGTRTYEVYSVAKISVNDVSVLNSTSESIITLITCVMDQPEYRWCVQAKAV